MNEHEFPEGDGTRCVHCGTLREHHLVHPTMPCPRGKPAPSALAPEPARRLMAADDEDTIYRRIEELRAERQSALNTIEEQTG